MPLSGAVLDLGAGAIRSAITHLSLASTNPEPSGSNQIATTPARMPVTWGAVTPTTGDFAMTGSVAFSLGPANNVVSHVCFWSASTGGTYYGSQALSGDTNLNSAGEYTITALTVNGAST